jgi:prophage regulatory protein
MTLPSTGYVRQAQLLTGGVPLSAATLWRKVRAQTFPAPVKFSAGVTAWRVEDVRAWMENQPTRPGNARSTSEEGGPVINDALIEKLAVRPAAHRLFLDSKYSPSYARASDACIKPAARR